MSSCDLFFVYGLHLEAQPFKADNAHLLARRQAVRLGDRSAFTIHNQGAARPYFGHLPQQALAARLHRLAHALHDFNV